jgi:hypothetical protein
MRRTRLTCIFGVLSVWPSPPRAQAHSVELLTQLAFHPSDPGVMALRYVNGGDGLLYTYDAGASWQVLCGSVIGADDTEAGPIAITGDGTTLMGLADGLWHDEGRGCAWSKRADFPEWVSDFDPDPLQPGATYAATWTGGAGLNGIVRRDESGLWTDVGVKEQVLISRLRVVKRGAGVRFYESVIRAPRSGDAGVVLPRYLIRSSDDLGASWDEHPFSGPQGKLSLQAVDPTDPDRLVVLVELNNAESKVFVSADAGVTFEDYLMLAQFGGIALTPEGHVWIGDAGNATDSPASQGLWMASSLREAPRNVADYPVRCLGYQPATETLFACQDWSFGQVSLDGGRFTAKFEFTGATQLVACEGVDMAAACRAQLCGGWCGSGHFAQAPLCAVYSDPACDPVAPQGNGDAPILPPLPEAGASDAAGAPPDRLGQDRVNDRVAAEDAGPPHAGSQSHGGCSVRAARAHGPRLTASVVLACTLSFLRKRRKRTHSSGLRSR